MNPEQTESIDLLERLALIRSRVSTALVNRKEELGRVTLIAVGKGHSADSIRQLYAIGVRDFAENYGQEFLSKKSELDDLEDIQWHFIGHLQSNKAKKIAQTGCLIHSVDRISLVDELIKAGCPQKPIKILLQLQIDPTDLNKSGCSFEEATLLCGKVSQHPHLSWQGFMGIGPAQCSPEKTLILYENFVRKARSLWEEYSLRDPSRSLRPMLLSLGMSDDLEIAVRCGATHIRVGSALLGPRPKK